MSIRTTSAALTLVGALLLTLPSSLTRAQQLGASGSPIATTVPDSEVTKVFVLGSTHLSGVADQFEPSMIDSLIAALDAFGPDAIAIERLPGRQVAAMERWGGRLDDVNQQFAAPFLHHGHLVQKQSGWSWSEANQRADSLLAMARSDSLAFGAKIRLSLIRSLTAAYRLPSAALSGGTFPLRSGPRRRFCQTRLPDGLMAASKRRPRPTRSGHASPTGTATSGCIRWTIKPNTT